MGLGSQALKQYDRICLVLSSRHWMAGNTPSRAGQGHLRHILVPPLSTHRPLPCAQDVTRLTVSISTLLGPLFFVWLSQLLLPTMLLTLVYEKEKR